MGDSGDIDGGFFDSIEEFALDDSAACELELDLDVFGILHIIQGDICA